VIETLDGIWWWRIWSWWGPGPLFLWGVCPRWSGFVEGEGRGGWTERWWWGGRLVGEMGGGERVVQKRWNGTVDVSGFLFSAGKVRVGGEEEVS